ncbi:MAG: GNAT family N-acetyltransferase [Thalassobaculum sp.]|uniref:GNAT family N-acetyltransferase n=1 Tax=Thalassobaculum sp. TaxID=2022740 RepID=UPI0032EBA958
MSPGVEIRPVRQGDLEALVPLNNAAVPAVNALRRQDFERFAALVPYFRVAVLGDAAVGMMIALGPGVDYDSPNYRWFERRYDGFLYVDRIVVDPAARSAGIGAQLYADLAAAARDGGVPRLACEVNLRPANDRSLRFHERLGFRGVGTQDTENGSKTVQLMIRELDET